MAPSLLLRSRALGDLFGAGSADPVAYAGSAVGRLIVGPCPTTSNVAIVRVEQLAPVPADEILAAVRAYPNAEIMWVQDEPANQGAWPFMAMNLPQALASRGETRALRVASRVASASPATGSSKKHAVQQAQLIATAFDR